MTPSAVTKLTLKAKATKTSCSPTLSQTSSATGSIHTQRLIYSHHLWKVLVYRDSRRWATVRQWLVVTLLVYQKSTVMPPTTSTLEASTTWHELSTKY